MAGTSKNRKTGIQVIARAAAVLRALEGEAAGRIAKAMDGVRG